MQEKVMFNLPDFGEAGKKVYTKIINLNKQTPDIFYPNTGIDCIYDAPDGCSWMGGGICYTSERIDLSKFKDDVDYFNYELNIPLCFVFSNPTINNQKECEDLFCNQIAKIGERDINQIMISSPILENYIRKNFMKYKINKSIIASQKNVDDIILDFSNYNKIVLPRKLNTDFEFLLKIPQENRKQVEFLCSSSCPSNCEYTYQHYIVCGEKQKRGEKLEESDIKPFCMAKNNMLIHIQQLLDPTTLIRQELDLTYTRLGFQQFKLSGRRSIWAICNNIVEYMILPIYQKDILKYLLDDFISY